MGMPLFKVYVVRYIRRTIVVNGALLLVASLRTPLSPPRSHAGHKIRAARTRDKNTSFVRIQ